jgi:hypothetical protein
MHAQQKGVHHSAQKSLTVQKVMGKNKAEEMKRDKIETVKETERFKGYSHEMDRGIFHPMGRSLYNGKQCFGSGFNHASGSGSGSGLVFSPK